MGYTLTLVEGGRLEDTLNPVRRVFLNTFHSLSNNQHPHTTRINCLLNLNLKIFWTLVARIQNITKIIITYDIHETTCQRDSNSKDVRAMI